MKHAGLLRQFLTDDKGTVAILVWGCPPFTHIDNSYRAAHAAVELQAALSQIVEDLLGESDEPVSAGVTSGWAFAGNVGGPSRAEYTVMGDVVNVAARIMGERAASGGGVACDAATREFLASCRSLGGLVLSDERHVRVKGKAEPIALTDLSLDSLSDELACGAGAAVPGPCTSAASADDFVGRKHEQQMLSSIAGEYLAGLTDSAVVVVEARQGMGKVCVSILHIISGRQPSVVAIFRRFGPPPQTGKKITPQKEIPTPRHSSRPTLPPAPRVPTHGWARAHLAAAASKAPRSGGALPSGRLRDTIQRPAPA